MSKIAKKCEQHQTRYILGNVREGAGVNVIKLFSFFTYTAQK
jgi:hypothetical protein